MIYQFPISLNSQILRSMYKIECIELSRLESYQNLYQYKIGSNLFTGQNMKEMLVGFCLFVCFLISESEAKHFIWFHFFLLQNSQWTKQ